MYPLLERFVRSLWDIVNFIRWPKVELGIVLWPPAKELFDDIENEISKYYPVLSSKNFKIKNGQMKKFLLDLYEIDKASERKISSKIDRLLVPPHEMRFLKIKIRWPRMRSHCNWNAWVKCKKVNDLKIKIRTKFKTQISDYKYDVIIHSTETDSQIAEVNNLIVKYSEPETQLERVKLLNEFMNYNYPKENYVLLNSAWLPLLNIRENGDLDVMFDEKLYSDVFEKKIQERTVGLTGDYAKKVRVQGLNSPYMKLTNSITCKELIHNHSVQINGVNFVTPSLYIKYKIQRLVNLRKKMSSYNYVRKNILKDRLCSKDTEKCYAKYRKDEQDIRFIQTFFKENNHLDEKFSNITNEQWGADLVNDYCSTY